MISCQLSGNSESTRRGEKGFAGCQISDIIQQRLSRLRKETPFYGLSIGDHRSEHFLHAGSPSFAQKKNLLADLPSNAEIQELAAKADEKVQNFEKVLKASSGLQKDVLETDLAAAQTAHTIVADLKKNGPSSYALVSLVATLDDIALDASRAAQGDLMAYCRNGLKGNSPDQAAMVSMMGLLDSETSVNDISELVLHATLRYVKVESDVLNAAFQPASK
jgi:hypothetical protein